MAIIVTGGGEDSVIKHTAPAGVHQAVCVDVLDKGILQTQFGEKPKIDLRWQLAALDPDGHPHIVQKRYTKSLNDRATLRHDLESWRGKEFTAQELKGFDVEKLIGVNCQVLIVHKQNGDRTWANVQAVMPAARGAKKLVPTGYARNTETAEAPADQMPDFGPDPEPLEEAPF